MKPLPSGWFRSSSKRAKPSKSDPPPSPPMTTEAPLTPLQAAIDYLSDNSERDDASRYFAQAKTPIASPASSPVKSPKLPSLSPNFYDLSHDKYTSGILSSSTDDSSRAMWRSFSEEEITPLSTYSMGKRSTSRSPSPTRPVKPVVETREPEPQPQQSQQKQPQEVSPTTPENVNEVRDQPLLSLSASFSSMLSGLSPTTDKKVEVKRPILQLPSEDKFTGPEDQTVESEGVEVVDGRLTKELLRGLQKGAAPTTKDEKSQPKVPAQEEKGADPSDGANAATLSQKESAKENNPGASDNDMPEPHPKPNKQEIKAASSTTKNVPDVKPNPLDNGKPVPAKKTSTEELTPDATVEAAVTNRAISDKSKTKTPDDKPKTVDEQKATTSREFKQTKPTSPGTVTEESEASRKGLATPDRSGPPENTSVTPTNPEPERKTPSIPDKAEAKKITPLLPDKSHPEKKTPASSQRESTPSKEQSPDKKGSEKKKEPKATKAKTKALGQQTKSAKVKKKSRRFRKSRKGSIPSEIVVDPQANPLPITSRTRTNRSMTNIITQDIATNSSLTDLDIIDVAPAPSREAAFIKDNSGGVTPNTIDRAMMKEYVRLRKMATKSKRLAPKKLDMETGSSVVVTKPKAPSQKETGNLIMEEIASCTNQSDIGIINVASCSGFEEPKRLKEANIVTRSSRNSGMVGKERVLCSACMAKERESAGGSKPVKSSSSSAKQQVCHNCLMLRAKSVVSKGEKYGAKSLDGSARNDKEGQNNTFVPGGKNAPAITKGGTVPLSSNNEMVKAGMPLCSTKDGDESNLQGGTQGSGSASKRNSAVSMKHKDEVAICLEAANDEVHRVCSFFPKKLLGYSEEKVKSSEANKTPKKKKHYRDRRGLREPVPIKTIEFPLQDDAEKEQQSILSHVSSLTNQPSQNGVNRSVTWAAKLKEMQTDSQEPESQEHEQKHAEKKKAGLGRFAKPKQKILYEA